MTALASTAERLDNALAALDPLVVGAMLNDDAAYQRLMLGKVKNEVVAAKRLVNSLLLSLTEPSRREALVRQDEGSVRLTFDRAARVPRNAWPPAEPADGEGSDL